MPEAVGDGSRKRIHLRVTRPWALTFVHTDALDRGGADGAVRT